MEEKALIKKILAGEKELYGELIKQYNQTLYRVVKGYIKREFDAEEIMEIAYVKAYENLPRFKQNSSFGTWLTRIAINEALQFNRKSNKLSSLDSYDVEVPDSTIKNPEEELIMNETTYIYETAISELDPIYKSVFIMKEINQMSIKEIAECMDISESNAKVRLHRAKTMIKENLFSLLDGRTAFEFGNQRCDLMVIKVMRVIAITNFIEE